MIDEFDQESTFYALVTQIRRSLPSLERLKTPYLFATNAAPVFGRANRDRTDFAIALSFLKDADLVSGENVLRRIAHRDASRAVRKELMERAQEVLARIGSNDVDALLNTWECETIAQLRSCGVILDDNPCKG